MTDQLPVAPPDTPMAGPNHTPLTPLLFLERAAIAFPGKEAIVYGDRRITYAEMARRVTRTAQSFRASGVRPGDRVAYLCPNVPEMLEAHFAVALAGAVLVAINTRLSPTEITFILGHSGARLLVADTELLSPLDGVASSWDTVDEVVALQDPSIDAVEIPTSLVVTPFEDFLERGSDEHLPWAVADEFATISINYTSGTTGRPKGVQYTHRGAYLNALGELIHSRHTPGSVYLWTLPMFHCNGWCTTWAVTAIGATHVCLRAVRPDEIWRLIESEGVTHLNAAPTVLIGLVNDPAARPFPNGLVATTAGAPPSPTVISQMTALGAEIVHVYGLTETYGPHTVCEIQPGWERLDPDARAGMMSRQGVPYVIADPVRVANEPDGGGIVDVDPDGATMGEVLMRGNNVMGGYFADQDATADAFRGGWFHSGDLGVMHPDNYVQLRDRAKDIIISGGENISTIEVEQAIVTHPDVLECAVVAAPHETWGERPRAFVVAKPGTEIAPREIIDHVRDRLAHFKAPDEVIVLAELPKTSTGKVQKFVLRESP